MFVYISYQQQCKYKSDLFVHLLQYLRLSLTCMCEAWEDILMQMDLRLTKFVQVS